MMFRVTRTARITSDAADSLGAEQVTILIQDMLERAASLRVRVVCDTHDGPTRVIRFRAGPRRMSRFLAALAGDLGAAGFEPTTLTVRERTTP